MKYLALVLLSASLAASGGASARAQGKPGPVAPAAEYNVGAWKEFVSAEGRFSINVVVPLRHSKQPTETALGKLDNHMYVAQTATAGYMVAHADFPVHADTPEFLAAVMDGARDNVLAVGKGRRLLSEKEITLGGHGGREWLVADGEMLYRARAFMVQKRFYQVLLLTTMKVAFRSGRPSADADNFTELYEDMSGRFLGSFKLLPAAPSPTPKP